MGSGLEWTPRARASFPGVIGRNFGRICWHLIILDQGQHIFLIKDLMVSIFSFIGHVVSITGAQLHYGSMKAAIDNT